MKIALQLIETNDEKLEKRGLQELCQFLEGGNIIYGNDRNRLFQSISKFQVSESVLVRRWLYKLIGLLKEKAYLPFLKGQLNGDENDSENITWIVAALHNIDNSVVYSDIIRSTSSLIISADLSAGYFDSKFLPKDIKKIKRTLDGNDILSLKWLGLLYGNAPDKIVINNGKFKDVITRLQLHEDGGVSEYSIWALHKSDYGSFSDCEIPPQNFSNHPTNVRRWLYRLITKAETSIHVYFDFIASAIEAEDDPSAKEGLAIGLSNHLSIPQIQKLFIDWILREKNQLVKYQLLKAISINIDKNDSFKLLLTHESENSVNPLFKNVADRGLVNFNTDFSNLNLDKLSLGLPSPSGDKSNKNKFYLSPFNFKKMEFQKNVDVIVITALIEDELESVIELMDNIRKVPDNNFHLQLGVLKGTEIELLIASQQKMGMVDASILTYRLIAEYNPKYLVMTGVCGGRESKNVKVGDVIVPKKVIDYQSGKMTEDGFKYYLSSENIDGEHIQHAQTIIENALKAIEKTGRKGIGLRPHFRTMACGNLVVNKEGFLEGEIAKFDDEIVGVDMESYGFIRAQKLSYNKDSKALIVKAVMDLTEGKSDKNKNFAAYVSAQVVKYLLEAWFLRK